MVQMTVIGVVAVFLVFRFTGRDYDSAVMASGFHTRGGNERK